MKNNSSLLAGKATSIPAYYEGQVVGVPDHYVSREQAIFLKDRGMARSINRGKAILIKGIARLQMPVRESVKARWEIIGQTKKNSAPGFPHWGLV